MNKPNSIILLACAVLVILASLTSAEAQMEEQEIVPAPEPTQEPTPEPTIAPTPSPISPIGDKPSRMEVGEGSAAIALVEGAEDYGINFEGAKTYKATAYCACAKCCGKSDGITASGAKVKEGVTVAMKGVKFGTVVYIEGVGRRVVQDRGVGGNCIDIYFSSHREALKFGVKRVRVVIGEV